MLLLLVLMKIEGTIFPLCRIVLIGLLSRCCCYRYSYNRKYNFFLSSYRFDTDWILLLLLSRYHVIIIMQLVSQWLSFVVCFDFYWIHIFFPRQYFLSSRYFVSEVIGFGAAVASIDENQKHDVFLTLSWPYDNFGVFP